MQLLLGFAALGLCWIVLALVLAGVSLAFTVGSDIRSALRRSIIGNGPRRKLMPFMLIREGMVGLHKLGTVMYKKNGCRS